MKKILKGIIFLVGGLIALAIIFYVIIYFKTEARINKVYSVKLQTLTIPTDSVSRAAGMHVAENRGCLGCHGDSLDGGRDFMNPEEPLGVLYSKNITSGKGGIQYKDEDWIRVLRHGLGKENKSVWFMPAHDFYQISNQEMAQLISFVKSKPPVDHIVPAKSLKPFGRFLTFMNKFPLLPAEKIDHNAVFQDKVDVAITAQYGAYLTTICRGCHGDQLKGGPAHEKLAPPYPDITATGSMKTWKETDLITALRTGKKPDGKIISDFMPWKVFNFTDDEMKAIYLHLKALK